MTFSTMAFCNALQKAIQEKGFVNPTPIQAQAIPAALGGKDIVATAQTGSGKTASFVLPILELLGSHSPAETPRRAKRIRALVLVPTRELALQVEQSFRDFSHYLAIRVMAMVGGIDYEPQKTHLIDGLDIVVATPGRLLDMANQRAVHFDEVTFLVIDEADRMLDMGFIGDITNIIDRLPTKRQTMLFSATMPKAVRALANAAVNNAIDIALSPQNVVAPQIAQWVVATDKHNKSALLSHLITEYQWPQALIFIRTQHGAAKLVSQLEKRGIAAECIHAGKSQASRTEILAGFKSGKHRFLVATGVAARGIDIHDLACVVNYDLPDDANEYVHRVGRTGRAGALGQAVSLVSKDDFKRLCAIERRLDKIIDRKVFEGFDVVKDLPPSNLNFVIKSNSHSPYQAGLQKPVNPIKNQPTKPAANVQNPQSSNVWAKWIDKNHT